MQFGGLFLQICFGSGDPQMYVDVCMFVKQNEFSRLQKKIKQINTNDNTNDRHLTLSNHCCSAALQGKPHPKATDFSQKNYTDVWVLKA